MKDFNLNKLKENSKFLIISISVVIVFLVLSLFIKSEGIKEEELIPSGKNNISELIINEIQTNNDGTIMAPDGGIYDWIEIYNGKSKDVNLTGYSLSDNTVKIKWEFPENTIIKSKEYLVVFLSGQKSSGLVANFKLSSGGNETVVLRNKKKTIVDAAETISLNKNQVMGRDNGGTWHVYNKGTPGFINTEEGYSAYIASLKSDETPSIVINEILPNNKGRFKNNLGLYSGYIEIKNVSEKTVNLSTYAISNDEAKPFKYNLPDVNLNKNEIFLLFTSGKNVIEKNEYHAGFKLDNKNGMVIISHNGKIVSEVTYEALANGLALVKDTDQYVESADLTPGLPNNEAGTKSYNEKYLKTNESLIISEVMTSNYSYLPHNGDTYYDWIELYNNSNKEINLKDYCLGKEDTSCKNTLPDVTLKAKEYYVLMASGDTKLSNNTYKHLSFKVGDNDTLYLFKDKTIIDTLFVPTLDPGYSYGKGLKHGEYYYSSPTPNKENTEGLLGISTPPTFNQVGGIYNNIDSLSISLKGGEVYYTLDGSNPTKESIKYTEPITLKKTTVIKAVAIQNGKKTSKSVTNSYIINENHTVPVMSLSLNPSDFKYLNKNAWTVGVEVPAYTEYFDGDDGFSISDGLRLFGGSTRGPSKKSYALKFKKKYGAGSLNYQVFENRDYASFDTLVLRTASQDEDRAIIRDLLGTSLVDGVTKAYVQAYKTIILYINGEYWGLYYLREKVDANYVSNNFNVSADNTDVIRIDGGVTDGNKNAYNNLLSYINSHNMADDEAYKHVTTLIDIDSFIDFWVAETYVTNNDIVNFRFFRNPKLENGKFKFVFYDLDWAFYNYTKDYYSFATSASGMGPNHYSTTLLRNLVKNKDFSKRFVERVAYQLKHVWNEERVNKYMNDILKELEPELARNFSRWKLKEEEHLYQLGRLKTYLKERESYMIKQTKSFFNVSASEWEAIYEAA